MKKGKKAILAIAAIVVMGMAVIPVSIVASDNGDSIQSMLPFGLENAKKVEFEIKELGTTATLGNMGNVLITPNSPEDDHLPSITKDQHGNIVVGWTHEISALDADIGIAYSGDNGNTWSSNLLALDDMQTYADIAYINGALYEGGGDFNGIWVTWIEPVTETHGCGRFSDITDLTTFEGYTGSEGSAPGATYNSFEDDSWYYMGYFDQSGPVTFMIYDGQGLSQGLVLYWWDGEFGGIVENWDAESIIKSSPSKDPDLANVHDSDPAHTDNDYFYMTWQHDNPDTGKSRVGYKQVIPTQEADQEYVANQGYVDEGDYDAAHPDIDATTTRVVVCYMTNDNIFGSWDIKCAYSTDNGQTWSFSMVADNEAKNEMYPAVYMSGDTIFCAYVKEGNLYLVKSEDGGATWGEPKQINDQDGTVVAEENCVDIHSGGIVWTDNRNGDKDIYYAPLPAAILNVESISGGMGIKATVANTGTEDATGVAWSIDVSGLVFVGGHTEGTIDVPAGGEATISSGLVFGIGPGTITVTVGGVTKTASCFILGPLVLGVK